MNVKIQTDPLMRVEIYSHFFKVTKHVPRITGLMFRFAHKYTHIKFENRGGRTERVPGKTFAAKTADNSEFRFHIGQLESFKKMLEENFIESYMYEMIEVPVYKPTKIPMKMRSHWVLKDYQEEAKDFLLENNQGDLHSRLATMPTGTGKALPLNSKIKVPGGWKTMGEIQLGDTITAYDGKPSQVIGVYPQGFQNVYRFTFRDGRTAEATIDHLWRVYCPDWKNYGPKILSTKQILHLNSLKRKNLHIDLIQPENNTEQKLPIDPYLLGILIGDGCLTGKQAICFTTKDEFILNEVKRMVEPNLYVKHRGRYDYVIASHIPTHRSNELLTNLRELGVLYKHSYNKTIPDIYMNGSIEQRIAIIQGLLDTDGHASEDASIRYHTTSEKLALQVQELIFSLGGISSITKKKAGYKKEGIYKQCRDIYEVGIRYSFPRSLFRLERKRQRLNETHGRNLRLRIENIEHIGQKDCQCIAIDHPSKLFVTDNYVVTHNTVTALAAVLQQQERVLVAVLPKYQEKWCSDIAGIADISTKEIMLVQGSDQLRGLVQMAVDRVKLPKMIVISLTTIQNFFKAYEEDRFSDDIKAFGCLPEELCEKLDIGTIVVDEAHEHLYSVFRLMMYSHVPKFIALSGTLISGDPFIEKIQHLMFPREIRFDKIKMEQYIKVYPISYVFRDIMSSKIRTTEFGSKNYSQIAFEKSILKRKDLLENYLKLIDYVIEYGYIRDYQPGDKLAVYAGSIAMCTTITEHLKKKYSKLDVRRYVEQDPYANVIESDIRVTTILSAGTALDIPNLRTVIMTNNINSPVANLQTLGRLRKLPDRDVKFFYLYCSEIKKQVDYHHNRMELFRDRVATIKEFRSPLAV